MCTRHTTMALQGNAFFRSHLVASRLLAIPPSLVPRVPCNTTGTRENRAACPAAAIGATGGWSRQQSSQSNRRFCPQRLRGIASGQWRRWCCCRIKATAPTERCRFHQGTCGTEQPRHRSYCGARRSRARARPQPTAGPYGSIMAFLHRREGNPRPFDLQLNSPHLTIYVEVACMHWLVFVPSCQVVP